VLVWTCIRYLLILSASAWVGRYLALDPGYLVIQYHGYSIETSIFFVLLLMLLIFTLLAVIMQLFHGLGFSGRQLLHALLPNRERRYQQQLFSAISYKLAEQPQSAASAFCQAHKKHPTLPLLLAAIYHTPLDQSADSLIEQAYIQYPRHTDLIDMLFIHRLILGQQYKAALDKLQQLPNSTNGPAKDYFLLTCYRATDCWDLAKPLMKSRFLSKSQKQLLENDYYTYTLNQTAANRIQKTWKKLPSLCKKNPILLDLYCKKLVENDQAAIAIRTLEGALLEQPTTTLIERYTRIQTNNTAAQLQFLLSLLAQHPHHELLIFAIANLYQKQGEPLNALVYMEKILGDTHSISILLAGAALYQSLNHDAHAQTIYERIQHLKT